MKKQVVGRSYIVNEFNKDLNNVILARFGVSGNNNNDDSQVDAEAAELLAIESAAANLVAAGTSRISLTDWIEPQVWKTTWKRSKTCEKCLTSSSSPPSAKKIIGTNEEQGETAVEGEDVDALEEQEEERDNRVAGCKYCDCVAHFQCLTMTDKVKYDKITRTALSSSSLIMTHLYLFLPFPFQAHAEEDRWMCEYCIQEVGIARSRYDAYQSAICDAKMIRMGQTRVAKRWRAYQQLKRFRRKKAAILLLQSMFRRRMYVCGAFF